MEIQKISPCLWFDHQAEEAARFYCSVFPRSRIVGISRYGEAGQEIHGRPVGSVMTVVFELDGQTFTALNGGPNFSFSEAISLQVFCDTQAELDRYWGQLSTGGDEAAQMCGWLKDQYGLSWQIVPTSLAAMMMDTDSRKTDRVMTALLQMKKLDVAALGRAYGG
jgi:predicted 3-demethylubiquinone-9 3-methyltransferase (glyoxalase superfamily)